MNRPHDTGNPDCDRFIRETFVREPCTDMEGEVVPKLLIKAMPEDTELTYEQAQALIRYLRVLRRDEIRPGHVERAL